MKRSKLQLENVNLIRKIAWELKKKQRSSTREPFEDLFQEGCIGYLKAVETYNPEKGAFSTHVWFCVSSAIKDYLKSMERKNSLLEQMDELQVINHTAPESEFFETLPEESKQIAMRILDTPKTFVVRTKEECSQTLFSMFSECGWNESKINFGINQLTKACN
jgi:RNA polymerase sigma factor (sigma-70 family)